MSLVSGNIPNFINGVSQQPYALRLASQGAEQVNGYSTIAEGLVKRPPTNHVAKIAAGPTPGPFLHTINRDENERYFLLIGNGSLTVIGLDGTTRPVSYPDGAAYLAGGNFSAVTVADYTIIVNKDVTPVMSGVRRAQTPGHVGLVSVRQGNYSTNYVVTLGGASYTYTTSKDDANTIQTQAIAARLRETILSHDNSWTVQQLGSTLAISRGDGQDFGLSASDDVGDTYMVAIKDRLQSFTDLPQRGVPGAQVEITGSASNAFDNFYVEFSSIAGSLDGVWQEIAKPGRLTGINPGSMPHILVRQADGSFVFKLAEWADCAAGNETTVPVPSFIDLGRPITDAFFIHNRLGFIAGEQVVFSRSGDLFNFWRASATALLDTDPIDLAANHTSVTNLRYAVPFNEELLLFADETQFVLSSPDVLTPKTAAINQSTAFFSSSSVRPVGAGAFLYFAAARGTATSVREYYVDGASRSKDADDVTAHVPHYIPPGCFKLAASVTNSLLIALISGAPNQIYAYQFYVANNQKQQAAWHRWQFAAGDTILQAEFLDDALYLLVQRVEGLFLERMDLDIGIKSGSLPYAVLLDRRVPESAVSFTYDAATNLSTVNLPYNIAAPMRLVVVGSSDPKMPVGYNPKVAQLSATQLQVRGNLAGKQFRVGEQYEFRYTMSTFVSHKASAGGGQIADTEGRLQIRRLSLNYAETGYFRVEVTPFRRETYSYPFTGRVIGSAKIPIGAVGVETGTFRVPVMAQNTGVTIELVNDSHIPCRFLTADWEGMRVSRSRPVS